MVKSAVILATSTKGLQHFDSSGEKQVYATLHTGEILQKKNITNDWIS
jgi:hypothetical protein